MGAKVISILLHAFFLLGWAFNSCCRFHLVRIYQLKSLTLYHKKAGACKLQAPAKQYLDILKDRHIKLKHAGWIQSCELLLASCNNQSTVFNRIVINNRAIILCRLPFGCFFKQLRNFTHSPKAHVFSPALS